MNSDISGYILMGVMAGGGFLGLMYLVYDAVRKWHKSSASIAEGGITGQHQVTSVFGALLPIGRDHVSYRTPIIFTWLTPTGDSVPTAFEFHKFKAVVDNDYKVPTVEFVVPRNMDIPTGYMEPGRSGPGEVVNGRFVTSIKVRMNQDQFNESPFKPKTP